MNRQMLLRINVFVERRVSTNVARLRNQANYLTTHASSNWCSLGEKSIHQRCTAQKPSELTDNKCFCEFMLSWREEFPATMHGLATKWCVCMEEKKKRLSDERIPTIRWEGWSLALFSYSTAILFFFLWRQQRRLCRYVTQPAYRTYSKNM